MTVILIIKLFSHRSFKFSSHIHSSAFLELELQDIIIDFC